MPILSLAAFGYIIMLVFCVGVTFLMLLIDLTGFTKSYRLKWSGKGRSEKIDSMNDEQYKIFLVKAQSHAGIKSTSKGALFIHTEVADDFIRHIANEHSFISMLFADDKHPYSRNERLCSFFILNCIMMMFLFFFASGYIFHNGGNEPRKKMMYMYEICVLSPIKVVVSRALYYILCAPCDRKWSADARWYVNIFGHTTMFCMTGTGFYALWRASLVLRVAKDELGENLPSYIWSVLVTGNLMETFLIYLKFLDISDKSNLPAPVKALLICVDKLSFGLLRIGEWQRQKVRYEMKMTAKRTAVPMQEDDSAAVEEGEETENKMVETEHDEDLLAKNGETGAVELVCADEV